MSSGFGAFVENACEQALLNTHTAYLGRVLRVDGAAATVQPLQMSRAKDGEVAALPVVNAAPRLRGIEVEEGDVCLCVVCERELGAALHGGFCLPAGRRHDLSDSVIVGVMER